MSQVPLTSTLPALRTFLQASPPSRSLPWAHLVPGTPSPPTPDKFLPLVQAELTSA